MKTTPSYSQKPKIQGQDEIIINAPISVVWPLIKDSKRLEDWGPPVLKIEVYLAPGQTKEGVGSKRKVYAKFTEKRKGWYKEIRTEQIEGRKIRKSKINPPNKTNFEQIGRASCRERV